MLSNDDDDDWEGGSLSQPLVWDGTCWVATVIVDCSDCFDHNLLARNGVRDRRIATDPANAGGRRIKGALCRWEEEILALGLKDVAGAGSIWCFLQGRGRNLKLRHWSETNVNNWVERVLLLDCGTTVWGSLIVLCSSCSQTQLLKVQGM